MASNAQLREDWDPAMELPAPAYMQTNDWLLACCPTTPTRQFRKSVRRNRSFMGVDYWFEGDDGQELPPAVKSAFDSLEEFSQLPVGWNAGSGRALQRSAVPAALRMIFEGFKRCAVPRLYPLSDGGVGIVWERAAVEFEVQVSCDGSLEALFEDAETGEEVEFPLGTAESAIQPYLERAVSDH